MAQAGTFPQNGFARPWRAFQTHRVGSAPTGYPRWEGRPSQTHRGRLGLERVLPHEVEFYTFLPGW